MTHPEHGLEVVLCRSIPTQGVALSRKQNYREYPLYMGTDRAQESMVAIADYGIAGQAYYSRPNPATGEPLAEVNPTVFLRKRLVEKLADINLALQQSDIVTKLFGGQVELYVEEGLRSRETQAHLYDTVFPKLIRKQQPDLDEADVMIRRNQMIAAPFRQGVTPPPHATGGAVDVTLRYVNPGLGYHARSMVNMGHEDGATGATAYPDYFEGRDRLSARDQEAQRNRRVFYWAMRGALLPEGESGLVCNPTEWWHWSTGDQLWAAVTEAPFAFYGAAEAPTNYLPEL